MRRVESITEILWGQKVSGGTISNLNQKCFAQIEEWRSRKLTERYTYVFVDGIFPSVVGAAPSKMPLCS